MSEETLHALVRLYRKAVAVKTEGGRIVVTRLDIEALLAAERIGDEMLGETGREKK